MRTCLTLSLLTLVFATSSCHLLGKPRPVEITRPPTTTPSGVIWHDLLLGTGQPAKSGDQLLVDYTAHLPDGTLVFSTSDTGLPTNFSLGSAPVPGWNEALIGMRQGGKRSLEVPPALAYGPQGLPGLVPPNSPMHFEIELLQITP